MRRQQLHPDDVLTRRETEVLGLVAKGFTNPQIAAHLSIGPATVIDHMRNIFKKTGARNRVEAAVLALGHGMVLPHDANPTFIALASRLQRMTQERDAARLRVRVLRDRLQFIENMLIFTAAAATSDTVSVK
jgi:DNA-binding CsgD family transcriptional regulator